mmetsp:Transcript_31070/g.44113  ORF Transcript_31070/g.44113 Transcript_31070/m.44113 type:complete len:593 (+) Transcript_31070:117-1895(+)|eukprot:CAMPEP_0202458540 /NCGR_PEP_ID=MMETSP1360-20130828/26432_1 /ASSEMBLY_ACC=CAM_ASM_000848 /TAXON_ID=515479 /ORGANISM="Licmophora paradoxa, Strain CCMP2313" /LENGTH=592 /DNA_ID=CAMNT_0049079131 /DNA_START=80 /DNA_END=1858 /DNA_ORIENTATION=+
MVSKTEAPKESNFTFMGIFLTKSFYQQIGSEFHPFHRHDLNVFCHLWTTALGVWGCVQLALNYDLDIAVYVYAALVVLTVPLLTGLLHTAMLAAFLEVSVLQPEALGLPYDNLYICIAAIVLGYGLQDVSHWIFCEKTYMETYMGQGQSWKFIVHCIFLMPLVIDSILMRYCFLPNIVNRNRNVVIDVASKDSVDDLRKWVRESIPETPETTHVWPHEQEATSKHVKALEDDSAIHAEFRTVFAAKHFDIRPIIGMNEIYVSAVGAKKAMSSDAVFYTPHVDGPWWFFPGASCYRCLVGVTPNKMVRTNFNLQHETEDQCLGMYGMVGFDYNRELHWIDHAPGVKNDERRTVIKLHYVVYPKGWHWYGNLVASCNQTYNTWARGNFLKTLRPESMYERVMAWWIWLTTWFNAYFELYVGWSNMVYLGITYACGPTPFLILTSFRHYMVYMTTFAFRSPPVAHGYLMRDAKFYKTVALCHLGRRLLPLVEIPQDLPGVALAVLGFSITIMATAQLGFVRTYFGSELGFVKPKWIEGFPYGYIPHPMIAGQLIAYSSILYWFQAKLTLETVALIATHMSFYTAHMIQEMLYSSY